MKNKTVRVKCSLNEEQENSDAPNVHQLKKKKTVMWQMSTNWRRKQRHTKCPATEEEEDCDAKKKTVVH